VAAYPSPTATPWETIKQQTMATHWENNQNCVLGHKVLKVEGGDSGKISLLQFGLIYWNARDVANTKSLKHGFQGND
jgi:hypothetical protein